MDFTNYLYLGYRYKLLKCKLFVGKKMNKKVSSKLGKTVSTVMIGLVLTAVLFVFTSCRSDYSKALSGETETAADESIAETTAVTDANTSDQSETSGKETAAATSGSETGTTAAAETTAQPANSDTQQIIEVIASGGYSPRKIEAKADVPTILIMKSEGAYGCERAFNIPDLKISEILPENGQTRFDLGTQAKGTKLLGVCSMGMYSFQIFFK